MYGNDATTNGYLQGTQLGFSVTAVSGAQVTTNIPSPNVSPSMYGYNFTRWIMRFPAVAGFAGRSVEIINDDWSGNTHVFTVGYVDGATYLNNEYQYQPLANPPGVYMVPLVSGTTFDLDGRWLRAFNGPGMGHTP